jgi:uncharacterized Zn-finger protein
MARGVRNKVVQAPAQPATTIDFPAPETIEVRSGRIACDGVGGALGHPRVWLEMGEAAGDGPEDERLAPGVYEGARGH